MEKTFYPLSSLQEVYTLLYLSGNFDIELEIATLIRIFNAILNTNYDKSTLMLAIKKFYSLMDANEKSFSIFSKKLAETTAENKLIYCEALFSNCKFCKNKLIYTTKSSCVVFTLCGPKLGLLRAKYCSLCEITYNANNYHRKNKYYSYKLDECNDFVVTSSESVFEISLLKDFDNHLVRNAISFSGFNLLKNVSNY